MESPTNLIARQHYLAKFPSHHMHSIGLVINPHFPFLAASPDARVCTGAETVIAEIKCPFSARDLTVEEACSQRPDFCLTQDENGCHLKHSHEYWHQVQGQLMVTGASHCIFIVYTHKSLHTELIQPCAETMHTMFEALYHFYSQYGHKYIESLSHTHTSVTSHTAGDLEMSVYPNDSD